MIQIKVLHIPLLSLTSEALTTQLELLMCESRGYTHRVLSAPVDELLVTSLFQQSCSCEAFAQLHGL